jgi:hypothetical protein
MCGSRDASRTEGRGFDLSSTTARKLQRLAGLPPIPRCVLLARKESRIGAHPTEKASTEKVPTEEE